MPESGSSGHPNLQTGLAAARIERTILLIRGQRVLLDEHLAALYGVRLRALLQAVKRNRRRFPSDFLLLLTPPEVALLHSQTPISRTWGGRRYRPCAFTEQGVAMLSSVLKSPRAVMVNIEIMRAFVRLRRMLQSNEDLARKIEELERMYDGRFRSVFDALRDLMQIRTSPERRIGFHADHPGAV